MLDTSLLALLRFISPTLPVGAFAYSQGLEGGVEQGFIKNQHDSQLWITQILENNIAHLDLPALYWQIKTLEGCDVTEFVSYNATVFAYRETSELRLESQQMGQALLKLLRDTYTVSSRTLWAKPLLQSSAFNKIDWLSAFALACYLHDIEHQQALLGFGWAWCENQVAAAIKLVPLGQTQGQQLLIDLSRTIADVVEGVCQSIPDKRNIGAAAPGLSIISSLHETQYSRLFRS